MFVPKREARGVTFADIERARERIRGAIYVSPCAQSQTLSEMTGARVSLKLENLQMTGSFKERGALNRLLTLTPEERGRGVVAASAGNHAQALAYHAHRLGVTATLVMPTPTPLVKVSATRRHGARVVLSGVNYDEAYAEARRIEAAEGLTFVHPFDDADVIAGQGTIGLELLEQNPYLDVVVTSVGGGGLAGGVACALKETNPKIRVVGVEAGAVASMAEARARGGPVEIPAGATIADGIAVRRVGDVTYPLVARYVDDIVTVDEEEIASAILLLLEGEKTVVEGAGAVTLAAIVNRRIDVQGKRVALVLSGGNIDVNVLSRIIERGLVKDGRLLRLRVKVPDRPGNLSRVTALMGEEGVNILDVSHHRAFANVGLGETEIVLTLETRGVEHVEAIEAALLSHGFSFTKG
ncbi:MAG: threonine ammonia-lyase [Deltaproteobacteria bacterium]|nr:threonine ammonia-lyase [Deltaproteobacteria bacterium]